MSVKCPKCKWVGNNKDYMRHYARAHYKPKHKKGKKVVKIGKIPIWARRK